MPKLKISVDDLRTMYQQSYVIYKNKPVFIKEVENTFTFHVFDLVSQRNVALKIAEYEDLKAPTRHLGCVNVEGDVIYLSRRPVRRYRVGVSRESLVYKSLEGCMIGNNDAVRRVVTFTAPELVDTAFARYPTIKEAFDRVNSGVARSVAFDRQFSLDNRGCVFYKTMEVGKVKRDVETVYDIKFNKGFEHLIILLDMNYEKSASIPRNR